MVMIVLILCNDEQRILVLTQIAAFTLSLS